MSHPVSRTAAGRQPPRHPASGAGTWPSLLPFGHALTAPDHPQPGPRARPREGGARGAVSAAELRLGKSSGGMELMPGHSLTPPAAETRLRSIQTLGSRLSRRLEPDNPLRL